MVFASAGEELPERAAAIVAVVPVVVVVGLDTGLGLEESSIRAEGQAETLEVAEVPVGMKRGQEALGMEVGVWEVRLESTAGVVVLVVVAGAPGEAKVVHYHIWTFDCSGQGVPVAVMLSLSHTDLVVDRFLAAEEAAEGQRPVGDFDGLVWEAEEEAAHLGRVSIVRSWVVSQITPVAEGAQEEESARRAAGRREVAGPALWR